MTIFTIDVSHHDVDRRGGALDWKAVRAAGIQVTCAKATEGDPAGYNFADPKFISNCQGAKDAGLTLVGGYHCVTRGDQASINRQVDWLRSKLGQVGGLGSPGLWAMIDVEPFPELIQQGLIPRWDDVRRFADRWHQVTQGYPLAVYLPKWVWSGNLGSPDMSTLRGPLVSSNYGANAALPFAELYTSRGGAAGPGWAPYGLKAPELWQYGSSAKVPGCSSTTDVNAYAGTIDQLRARLTGAASTLEDDMSAAAENQIEQLYNAMFYGGPSMGAVAPAKVNADSKGNALVDLVQSLRADTAALKAQVAGMSGDQVDEAALAQQLLAALSPAAIAAAVTAALPADLAAQVVDELRQRLAE